MMNPGDQITIHLFDAAAPGGGHAFKVEIKDLTTGQTGYMQASAANGFANTSIDNCSGTPHNFQPEYSTASRSQHHSVGGAADEHLDRVRDRSLRAVHVGDGSQYAAVRDQM